MEMIYDQAKDQNVAALMIYGTAEDTKAYSDSGCKKQMTTSEMKDAFIKRAVIKIGDDYFIPISLSIATSTEVGTITYAKAGSAAGSAATATLVSIKG